jgi:molybdopterin molybdotransferase
MKADWLSVQDALRTVVDSVTPLSSETCPLESALHRVLSADLISPIDVPPWTNSAMDGFAVHGVDVVGASDRAPVDLPVSDNIAAGQFPGGPLRRGTAARVMTGAPVPDGADSVIRTEHTDGGRDLGQPGAAVRILSDQDANRNLRRKGEEYSAGSVGIEANTVLVPAAVGMAASLGHRTVPVVRRPLVALLTSGDELVDLDDFDLVLAGRKIVSSNSYLLRGMLEEAGCEVRDLGTARDSADSIRDALRSAAGCDALVTSAGISVGEHDYIKQILLEYDAEVSFWRVRMRPGSPFAFGRIAGVGQIPWFGLPGNPVSSAVTFEVFVRPALLRMGGRREVHKLIQPARLLDDHVTPDGLTQFVRVVVRQEKDGEFTARLTGPQGSGMLSSFASADGLMVIPADRPGARAGDVHPVIPLRGAFYSAFPVL